MKCPICGSEDYYEGLYGPNCGNPNCGTPVALPQNEKDNEANEHVGYGASASPGGYISAVDVENLAISFTKSNKIPKRKQLKRYGRQ